MKPSPLHRLKQGAGFSLMEMAVVLMIIGTLMSGVLVAVSQTALNARITNARAQIREVEEALYGYAQSNGHLPCPASNASDGFASPDTSGPCTEPNGFVPVATLGLYGSINDDGLLLDPWQNPLRYSVATQACATCGGARSFTSDAGMDAVFAASTIATTNMLSVCDRDCADVSAVIYSDIVPAIVYSMGANWSTYSSADEIQNSGNGSTVLGSYNIHSNADDEFIAASYSEDNFDDIVVWLSPYLLFNKLVSAGQLP